MRSRSIVCGLLAASFLAASVSPQDSPSAATLRFRGSESSADILVIGCNEVTIQAAMQPGLQLVSARTDDFAAALQHVINQRLVLHSIGSEEHLFEWTPTDQDIRTSIYATASHFANVQEFEKRLVAAGFESINDERFRDVMKTRWVIDKYIHMHFRLPSQATREMEERYYEEVFKPEFRRARPGLLLPTLDEKRAEVGQIVTEARTEAAVNRFLDKKRRLATIEMTLDRCVKTVAIR